MLPTVCSVQELIIVLAEGFTKTKRLKDTDNVASYLMAYLTNVPKDEIVPGTIKKGIIKGARLHFYPSGVHIML